MSRGAAGCRADSGAGHCSGAPGPDRTFYGRRRLRCGKAGAVTSLWLLLLSLLLPSASPAPGTGGLVYTVGHGATGYQVTLSSGALTPIAGSPFPGVPQVFWRGPLVFDPSGQFAYEVFGDGRIGVFTVDGRSGALTLIGTQQDVPGAMMIAIEPTGRFAYVASPLGQGQGLYGFRIDPASGGLTPLPGSPFGGTHGLAEALAIDPDGGVLYTWWSAGTSRFVLDPDTGVASWLPWTMQGLPSADCGGAHMVVVGTGGQKFLYGLGGWSDWYHADLGLTGCAIDASGGPLTLIAGSPFTPRHGSVYFSSIAAHPSGAFLYLWQRGGFGDETAAGYRIDGATGVLQALPGTFAAGSLAVDPSGTLLYAVNSQGVRPYAISTTGSVTALLATALPPAGNYISVLPISADMTPPSLNLPASLVAEATGAAGTTVEYTASATDEVDGPVPVKCAPASGHTFPIGETQMTCSAKCERDHTDTGPFTASVADAVPEELGASGNDFVD